LTKDERFNSLPFVTGSPFLKFYAGVPLITKRGNTYRQLVRVDSRVRAEFEQTEKYTSWHSRWDNHETLGNGQRGFEEHRRGMKMSRGLHRRWKDVQS